MFFLVLNKSNFVFLKYKTEKIFFQKTYIYSIAYGQDSPKKSFFFIFNKKDKHKNIARLYSTKK